MIFYIRLDNKHVVFGKVIDGMLTVSCSICKLLEIILYFSMAFSLSLFPFTPQVRKMENVPVGPNSKPLRPVIITEVRPR
jgi:hypothetical protein